jgi:hypothetical protein
MDFVEVKINNEYMLFEILDVNHIEMLSNPITVFKENFGQQPFDYLKNRSWDSANTTVVYYSHGDKVYRCIFVAAKGNYVKNIIHKTFKMKAFL